MTTLYLARHGQTEWNIQGRFQGHGDSPLTALGLEQAAALAERLKDITFEAIYASPAGRASHTAQIVRGRREITIVLDEALREINLGPWEGLDNEQVRRTWPAELDAFWHAPHHYQPPQGGESFAQLRERVVPFMEALVARHAKANVLVVTHATTLKTILAHYEPRATQDLWKPPVMQPTSLSIVRIEGESVTILVQGDASHLGPSAGQWHWTGARKA